MKKSIPFLCLILFLIIPGSLFAEDLSLLAVPNIKADGVSETLAATSRNMIETALIKTGKYIVLSYTDMEEILDAQAFSLSGCTDESCAIEIGELLAADNIVLGDLSQVGEDMVLSIRLVNVTSGHTVSGEVVTFNSLADMQDSVFSAAYALAGQKYTAAGAVTEVGSLYVTAPEGMKLEVSVDGKIFGMTPVLIENLSFGVHVLEAKAENYDYRSEISVASQEIMDIVADVENLKGNLFLTIIPVSASGYDIKIDGATGTSGLNRDIAVGEHEIIISGSGWYFEGEVTVKTGKTERYSIELIEAGTVQFFGPKGIIVEIETNGEMKIVSDISQPTYLPVGSYNYIISHEDYESVEGNLKIITNSHEKIEPSYEYNENWALKQRIAELEEKKNKIVKMREFMLPAAWTFTGLGGAGLGLGGIMEAIIQYNGNALESIHSNYLSSTDPEEIKTLGDEMNMIKDTIPLHRDVRNYSLITGGSSLLLGGVMFLFTPNTQIIDVEIDELQRRLK